MSVVAARITVGTTPTALWTEPAAGAAGSRKKVTIQNPSAAAVFIGTSAVTTTAYGYSLAATNGFVEFEVDRGDMLYGIVATGTNVVNVLVADI